MRSFVFFLSCLCGILHVRGWTIGFCNQYGTCSAIRRTTVIAESAQFLSSSDESDYDHPDLGESFLGELYDNEEEITDEELLEHAKPWDEKIPSFNTVHLVGRVGNIGEPKHLEDNKVVVTVSLACRRKYHYGERQAEDIKYGAEETDWFTLEIWGGTAEFVSKHVDKGARVGVIGSLLIDEWTDEETKELRTKAKILVREFDVLETKAEAELRRSNRQGGRTFYTQDDDEYKPSTGSPAGFYD